ncbi:MAG TPA: hypothetical protein VKB68_08420 [Stellaceae bacterium]|nr:hypothetical protein [Stellaceae bacterium]
MSDVLELPIVDGATRLHGIIGDPIVQVAHPGFTPNASGPRDGT